MSKPTKQNLYDILYGKQTSGRPERPDRPRRAPRKVTGSAPTARKMPPQCSSWGTFRDRPVRCEQRVGHEKRHLAYIGVDDGPDKEDWVRHTW